jgi:hypothetical protein
LILVRALFAALSQQSDRSGFSVRGEIEQPVVADKGGMPADGGPLSDDREAMGVLLHGSLVASGEGVAENARA